MGDRAYAIVDSTDGKVASAKNPRKWPHLFDFRAAFVEAPRTGAKVPPVRITPPDGTVVTSDQADISHTLSRVLSRTVTLDATDRRRQEAAASEKYWPDMEGLDHRDTVTDFALPDITGPCPRCVMTTLPQGDLPQDPGILRAAAQHNQVRVGVYASVLRGGRVRRGDPVGVETGA